MKDIEQRIIDKVPEDCPELEDSATGPFLAIPVKGRGVAYCLSIHSNDPVCEKCPFNKGVTVDNTKAN